MKETYYTPTLEEFHIGFEYERNDGDNWTKNICNIYDLMDVKTMLNKIIYDELQNNSKLIMALCDTKIYEKYKSNSHLDRIRIKYLDKEDLEDIGFIIEEEEIKPYGHYLKGKFRNNIELWYAKRIDNEKIHVSLKSKKHNGNLKVRIKNKSELLKLMKQSEML